MKSIISLFISCFLIISFIETSEASSVEANAKISRIIDAGTIEDDRGRIIRIQSVRGSNAESAIKKMSAFLPKGTLLQVSYRTTDRNDNIIAAVNVLKQGEFINYQWLAFDQAIAWYDGSERMRSIEEDTSLHLFMSLESPFNIGASIKGLTEQEYNEITVLRRSVYKARDEVLNTPSDKALQLTLDQLAVKLYSQHSENLYAWHFMNHPSSSQNADGDFEMMGSPWMDARAVSQYNARMQGGGGYASTLNNRESGIVTEQAGLDTEQTILNQYWFIFLLVICLFTFLYFKRSKPSLHKEDKTNKEQTYKPSEALNLESLDMEQALLYTNESMKDNINFSHSSRNIGDLVMFSEMETFRSVNSGLAARKMSGFGGIALVFGVIIYAAIQEQTITTPIDIDLVYLSFVISIISEIDEADLPPQDWKAINAAVEHSNNYIKSFYSSTG